MKQLSIYDEAAFDSPMIGEPASYVQPALRPTTEDTASLPYQEESTQHENSSEEQEETRVTEIILSREMATNLQLVLPMLAHLNQENRWLAWIDPPLALLKQWQQQNGSLSDDIMVLRSSTNHSAFELAQKALSAGTCHAVIVWSDQLTKAELDFLDQASREGRSHGIVLRHRR